MTAAVATGAGPRTARSTYSAVAIALHWLIALLILTNIGLAWYFNTLKGPDAVPPIQLHKSIGLTVLLLTLVRIGWRLTHRPPPLPATMAPWQVWIARVTHVLLYVVMLGMPLSGWAMVSASPLIRVHPTVLYGVVPWPAVPFPGFSSDQLHDARHLLKTIHGLGAWLAYATVSLHVAGALKHYLIDRDDVVARMIPFLARERAT
jgi:cytochrome b561